MNQILTIPAVIRDMSDLETINSQLFEKWVDVGSMTRVSKDRLVNALRFSISFFESFDMKNESVN